MGTAERGKRQEESEHGENYIGHEKKTPDLFQNIFKTRYYEVFRLISFPKQNNVEQFQFCLRTAHALVLSPTLAQKKSKIEIRKLL